MLLANPKRAGDGDVIQAVFPEIDAGRLLGQLINHVDIGHTWKEGLAVDLMIPDDFVR
jgi:hypothetical protein